MKEHTSNEWAEFFGIEIIDDDGWRTRFPYRGGHPKSMDELICMEEWNERMVVSTCGIIDSKKYVERYKFLLK